MATSITITDLPERVVEELTWRALQEGLSLQEYLHLELERILLRPTRPDWLARGQDLRRAWEPRTEADMIVEFIRDDRGW